MQCLDWEDNEDYTIYGREIDKEHQRIEVIMVPCNYKHAEFEEMSGEDTISDECIADFEKQAEYLGSINWLILHTEDVLRLTEFGDSAIER